MSVSNSLPTAEVIEAILLKTVHVTLEQVDRRLYDRKPRVRDRLNSGNHPPSLYADIAFAAERIANERKDGQDRRALGTFRDIYTRLLGASGFATQPPTETVAHFGQPARLRIGVADSPPLVKVDPIAVLGPAADYTRKVFGVAGFEYEYVRLPQAELIPAIVGRRIDVIAPILMSLTNRRQVVFSKAVSAHPVSIACLTTRQAAQDLAGRHPSADRIAVHTLLGEAGEILAPIIFRGAPLLKRHPSIREALQGLRFGDTVAGRVPMLVLDELLAGTLAACYEDLVVISLPCAVAFHFAFATHPVERSLQNAIDTSIETVGPMQLDSGISKSA